MTDTGTLLKSLQRDLKQADRSTSLLEALRWISAARTTVFELNQRAEENRL